VPRPVIGRLAPRKGGGWPPFLKEGKRAHPMTSRFSRSFAVVIHDVAPIFVRQLATIARALAPRIGDRVSAAVVPCWHGVPLGRGAADTEFLRLIERAFGEILQHGFTHRQDRFGLLSFFSGRSNELSGLTALKTRVRLEGGRALLRRLLSAPIAGFVPPAWQTGYATTAELSRCGFQYLVTFDAIRFVRMTPIPLVTWSWDWGIVAPLGRVGEWFGDYESTLRPDALPCVVVHPIDVDRGYLPRCLRVIDRLQQRGRTPVLFSELASTPPEGLVS
jgi:predicted deacetylase